MLPILVVLDQSELEIYFVRYRPGQGPFRGWKSLNSCSGNCGLIFMCETSRLTSLVKVLSRFLKMPFATTCFGKRGYFASVEFQPVSLLILCRLAKGNILLW